MDTRLKDIISKENRNVLKSFLGAQTFNIIVTCLIAWLMFGIVKPAVWPTKAEPAKQEQTATEKTEKSEAATDAIPLPEDGVVAPVEETTELTPTPNTPTEGTTQE